MPRSVSKFARSVAKILTALTALLAVVPCLAMFSNYNSILVGERAAGMGGAAIAEVGDASSCAWYNPATCAMLNGSSFSSSVGIYKKFDTVYGENVDFGREGLKVNQGFFQALPSSIGSATRFANFLPDYLFTLSIVVPEYDTFSGDLSSSGNSKTTLTLTDQSLWVGAAISKKISENKSFGLTAYYTARSYTKNLTDRTIFSSTSSQTYTEEKAFTQNALVLILGYFHNFSPAWSWGASLRAPSLQVAGSANYFDNTTTNNQTNSPNNFPSLTSHIHIPAKLGLGLAYNDQGIFAMAWDFSYYSAESYNDIECEVPGISEHLHNRAIWNGSFGMEYRFSDSVKGRLGFFTNFSSRPTPDPNLVRGEGDHVDMLGWSSNIAVKNGPITYTFGGYYIGGKGLSAQRVNQQVTVISKVQQVFTMMVASSYSY